MTRLTFAKIFAFLVCLTLILIGMFFVLKPAVFDFRASTTPAPEPEKPIILLFAGDIMLDRGVEYMVGKYGENDFSFPFLKISERTRQADLAIANLESQISDKGEKQGSIYSFRAEPGAIEGLKLSGFDILSLANNHSFDYGKEALQDSLNRLIDVGISPLGAGTESQAFSPTIKTVDKTKFAFFAYADESPSSWKAKGESFGIASISKENLERIKQDIKLAKELADLVIVSFHWGEEYAKEPSQHQKDLAKTVIDAGADLVVGSHPHVIQSSETYNGRYIFYSLGNFVFDQGFSEETLEGEILEVTIQDKKIKKVSPTKIKINEFFQPEIAL
ncbi:MAG: CapA family protein [bacterium]|nr:CapA family protein [bacterium]